MSSMKISPKNPAPAPPPEFPPLELELDEEEVLDLEERLLLALSNFPWEKAMAGIRIKSMVNFFIETKKDTGFETIIVPKSH